MADIRLDLTWDIDPVGDIELSVTPEGSDIPLGSFTLTEDEIAVALADDLEEFTKTGDAEVLNDWSLMAAQFRYYARHIDDLIQSTVENVYDED